MSASARVVLAPEAVIARDAPLEPGSGMLRFARIAGRTVLTRASAAAPLKLLNPRNAGPSAWAYLATFGGGLVGGDAIRVRIDVGRHAVGLVSTQASTKVYRSDRRASQELDADVDAGALLVVLPDPVTCFAGSDYTQEQRIRLQPGASLVLVDRLTAGRIDSGERWRFNRYASRTRIWTGSRLVLHDALTLGSRDGSPSNDLARRMGVFNCIAIAVLAGPAMQATASRLLETIGAAPISRGAEFLMSAAPVGDDGALLRIAGRSVEEVAFALRQALAVVPSLLGDNPWSRKW